MTEKILMSLNEKLGVIIKLLAGKAIEGKSKTDSIIKLGTMGIDRNIIAEIVDTKPSIVSTRLSEAKKKPRPKSKRAKKKRE